MARLKSVPCVGTGVTVSTSSIKGAGNGLWAAKAFQKNELVTEYVGELIDHATAQQLREAGLHTHIRVLNFRFQYIDGLKCADGAGGKGGASFANDARDTRRTNTVYVTRFDSASGRSRVFLQALRDIAAGEEIFVSYGQDYWRSMAALAEAAAAAPALAAHPVASAAVSDEALQCSDQQASQQSSGSSSSNGASSPQQLRRPLRPRQTAAAPAGAALAIAAHTAPPAAAAAPAAAAPTSAAAPAAAPAAQRPPRATRGKLPLQPNDANAYKGQAREWPLPKQTRSQRTRQPRSQQAQQKQQAAAAIQPQDAVQRQVDQQQDTDTRQRQQRQQQQQQQQRQHEKLPSQEPESAATAQRQKEPCPHSRKQCELVQSVAEAAKEAQTPTAAVQLGSNSTEPPVRQRVLRSVTRQLAFVQAADC